MSFVTACSAALIGVLSATRTRNAGNIGLPEHPTHHRRVRHPDAQIVAVPKPAALLLGHPDHATGHLSQQQELADRALAILTTKNCLRVF